MELPERWTRIEDEIRQLFPAVQERDGISADAVAAAERRLGAPLPPILRTLYLRCGAREDLVSSFENLLPPERLRIKDGLLIFATENQGACDWGLRWPLASEDPPVLRKDFTYTPVWEPDHDRLSDFFVWFVLWQAVNGGAPAGGTGDADAGLLDRVQGWRELDRTGCHWTDVRFFLRPGQAVCLVGLDAILVCAAARDGEAFAALSSSVRIEWGYAWPED